MLGALLVAAIVYLVATVVAATLAGVAVMAVGAGSKVVNLLTQIVQILLYPVFAVTVTLLYLRPAHPQGRVRHRGDGGRARWTAAVGDAAGARLDVITATPAPARDRGRLPAGEPASVACAVKGQASSFRHFPPASANAGLLFSSKGIGRLTRVPYWPPPLW